VCVCRCVCVSVCACVCVCVAFTGAHTVSPRAPRTCRFLGFLGTLLLPLDIGNHNGDDPVLQASWLLVYWVTFVLSWGVLPLQQEYYASGEFTFRRRLCQSLRINIAIYAAMALIGGGVIIWMMVKQVTGSLPLLGVLTAAGNAWGLLLIVVMLGYGLVEVPRALWKSSSLSGQKKRLQFHAPAVDSAFFEANSEMADIVQVLRDFDRLVPQDPHSTEDRELRGRMNEVMVKVPDVEAFPHAPARGKQRTEVPSLKELANWHGKLIKARGKLSRAHARWDTLVKRVMEIEALEAATAPATSDAAAGALGRSAWALRVDHVRWVWRKRVASPMYKVAAVCCGLASFAVLFGEVTIPSKIDVSPMGMLVAAAEPDMTMMSLMALLPLSYMCVCAYLSLFRMKFFDVIELSDHKYVSSAAAGAASLLCCARPGARANRRARTAECARVHRAATSWLLLTRARAQRRMTDPYSLCFNGIYLCRMQFALMFNYIYVLHRDDPSHESAFEAYVGGARCARPYHCGVRALAQDDRRPHARHHDRDRLVQRVCPDRVHGRGRPHAAESL
jgi:hypothetical protein